MIAGVLIYLFFGFSLAAREMDIRENVEIRELLREAVTAPTVEVLMMPRRVLTQRSREHRVAVEVRQTRDAFYVLFINEEDLRFPLSSRGTWIIKRDLATGDFVQTKIFFHSEPGSFVRLFPSPDGPGTGRTLMDVYLYDRRIHRNVPVAMPFSDVLTVPFAEIVRMTRGTVDWPSLIPPVDAALYENSRAMVDTIRPRLPGLPDAEDGAMDRNGRIVFIESLRLQERLPGFNCSGFAKWVADGLYKPLTGEYLDIEDLKHKPLEDRGSFISRRFEDERDPFFGLDWSRNIAASLARLETGSARVTVKSQDVRNLPYWKYREDIGYAVEDLPAVLYYLSLNEPGYFYIASINREFGTDPVLRQHIHLAVIFPHFDGEGRFASPVLERNVETGLKALAERYPRDFVHLVRIKARESFDPPLIE